METFAILRRTPEGVACDAICLEEDYKQLVQSHAIDDELELMPEWLFKLIHKEAYDRYIRIAMPYCIGIWLDKFYNSERDYTLDGTAVFMNDYMINVNYDHNSIYITLYNGCSALEIASLVLFLKEQIGDLMQIKLSETTLFSTFSEN
jgi:hypothetical protein